MNFLFQWRENVVFFKKFLVKCDAWIIPGKLQHETRKWSAAYEMTAYTWCRFERF